MTWTVAEQARLRALEVGRHTLTLAVRQPAMRRSLAEVEYEHAVAALADAVPLYAAPETAPLLDAAAATFQAEPWDRTDLVEPVGFLLLPPAAFETRRRASDLRSGEVVIPTHRDEGLALAFLWRAGPHGVDVWELSVGRLVICSDYERLVEGQVPRRLIVFQAIARILAQRIIAHAHEPSTRETRRWAERAGEVAASTVRVVRLRRAASASSSGHTAVDWQCRWLVSGHWRRHWWPRAGEHRQTWIAAHVKGPENRPLVVSRNVYEFDR